MTSQLVIFRAFLFIFFVPPTLDLKKIRVNQPLKKSGLRKKCIVVTIIYVTCSHNII